MKAIPERADPWWRLALPALLALALGLRLANGSLGSLKLDDFHSLYHARAPDLATFFRVLQLDNHPPLSFLLLRAARALGGEEPWVLRLPALLAGLGTVWLAWRLGRRLPCRSAQAAATLLVAASSLHVELSSDLRMYALLALASAGLLDGLLDLLEDGRGTARVALWTFVGLHSHYHFLYAFFLAGAAALLLALARPAYRARRRALCAALGLGSALSLPWYCLGFPAQLGHGLPPGGSNATPGRLLEGFKNLVFLNVSVAGPGLRLFGLAASAALIGLALAGARRLWCDDRARARLALPVLLGLSALAVPLFSWAAAALSPRAGFEWRYLAGSLAAFCLLAGVEACSAGPWARARRLAVGIVGVCALLFALLNVRDPGEEDYRGAVAWILDHAASGDAVVVADKQPVLFPSAPAWEFYVPRLAAGRAAPQRLEIADSYSLADPLELDGRQRVFCCLRSVPAECALLRTLRRQFPTEQLVYEDGLAPADPDRPGTAFGRSVYVHVFTRP